LNLNKVRVVKFDLFW
jgi:hypothetical protein